METSKKFTPAIKIQEMTDLQGFELSNSKQFKSNVTRTFVINLMETSKKIQNCHQDSRNH